MLKSTMARKEYLFPVVYTGFRGWGGGIGSNEGVLFPLGKSNISRFFTQKISKKVYITNENLISVESCKGNFAIFLKSFKRFYRSFHENL